MNTAVVLIISHKPDLSGSESASLKQCMRILGNYSTVLICPEGMDVTTYKHVAPELHYDFINPTWLSSYRSFNRLKISPLLYQKYRTFEYILFYELDAWVFRNELEFWCKEGYDYIGSPWFEGFYLAKPNSEFLGVGNGGFSLRKTSSHLKALRSWKYITPLAVLLKEFISHPSPYTARKLMRNLTIENNIFHAANNYSENEDLFWGLVVAEKFPWFRVPDPVTASHFAMEFNAPVLFERNSHKLPFGCHKWEALHPDFWKQFIHIDDQT